MSQKEKLISKLKTNGRAFTYDEAELLLKHLGFVKDNKGRTSGSRVLFTNQFTSARIGLHRPHPQKELKDYQVKQLLDFLIEEKLI